MPLRKKKKESDIDELPSPPSLSVFPPTEISPPPDLPPPSTSSQTSFFSPSFPSPPRKDVPSSSSIKQNTPSYSAQSDSAQRPITPTTPSSPRSTLGSPPLPEPPHPVAPSTKSYPLTYRSDSPLPEPPVSPSSSHDLEDQTGYIQENMGNEILDELRQTGFTSSLQNIKDERSKGISASEIASKSYMEAKEAYIAAGKKHLELNFFEIAAMNFTFAILCDFLGRGAVEASHLMSELASGMPSSVISSSLFQGARVLLKSVLIKNPTFFRQAEKWLTQNQEQLYKEDKELIQKALKNAEMIIEI